MDEVAQPLGPPLDVLLLAIGRHVERPLADEGLRVGRHVAQVVHDDEHLHHRPQRVEQGDLDGPRLGHVVAFLA